VTLVVAPLAALLIAFATGCGSDATSGGADASSFEGTPWVLASGIDVAGFAKVAPSVTFAAGKAAGSTGCNRFTGSYTVNGDALTFGMLATTQRACVPPADAVERAYVAALAKVARWRVDNGELALLDANSAEVLSYRAASPVGSWEATSLLKGTAITGPLAGTKITATFDDAGTLSGSAGCNTYSATYTTDHGTITITPPAGTKKLCPTPDGVMEQEAAYLAALPKAGRYQVEGDSLQLLTAEGTFVATFARAPST
jgi:heat shock protein HslJ